MVRGGLGILTAPWSKHLPTPIPPFRSVQASKRRWNWHNMTIFDPSRKGFRTDRKTATCPYSHEGLDAWTDQKRGNGVKGHSDHESGTGKCAQCGGDDGAPPTLYRGADYPPGGRASASRVSPVLASRPSPGRPVQRRQRAAGRPDATGHAFCHDAAHARAAAIRGLQRRCHPQHDTRTGARGADSLFRGHDRPGKARAKYR